MSNQDVRGCRRRTALAALVLVGLIGVGFAGPVSAQVTDYVFEDVTEQVFVGATQRTWGSAWGDFDGDGDADLFLGRHFYPPFLYQSQAGLYRMRDDEVFSPKRIDRHGCAWGEASGDGLADLYCTQGADRGHGTGPNQLFIQSAAGTFVQRARKYGVRNKKGRGRTVNWLDFDGDGDLDLFVGNGFRHGHGNVMFRNVKGGFKRAHVRVGQRLRTTGSSWADWDRDRDPDLLVLQRRPRPGRAGGVAFRNAGGRFRKAELHPVLDKGWSSGAWGDFDADGWIDLSLVRHNRAVILRNVEGSFSFVQEIPLERGRMSLWIDVENDGDLDLFVVRDGSIGSRDSTDLLFINRKTGFEEVRVPSFDNVIYGRGGTASTVDHNTDGRVDLMVSNGQNGRGSAGTSVLFENHTAARRAVTLLLRGGPQNPWGLGAEVVAIDGPRRYWTQVTDGFDFHTQSDMSRVHIGVGDAAVVDVRVEWPDGTKDCLPAVSAGIVPVPKGSAPC